MCLTVEFYCLCGVVARTERVQCSTSLVRPPPTRFEETHKMRQISMVLPREEWVARHDVCTQEACPQNTSTGTVNLAKCPGCSTLCCESASLPHGDNRAYRFDDLLDEGIQQQIERDLGAITTDDADNRSKSDFDFEKELELELERELMDLEVDVNQAEFLPRELWHTFECSVEFCPFNKESMAQANDKFSSIVAEMEREAEDPIQWAKEDDDQILSLFSHGADEELIAAVVKKEVADVHERLTYLRLLDELLM